jgi:hypothetical protein
VREILNYGVARALAHTAPKAYLTAMTFDDAFREGETKPGATLLLVVKKGFKISAIWSVGIPRPLSATTKCTLAPA